MFSNIAGIMERKDSEKFRRLVYRVSRGNAITVFEEIEADMFEYSQEDKKDKVVFFVSFTGAEQGALASRLKKICDGLGVKQYHIEENVEALDNAIDDVEA